MVHSFREWPIFMIARAVISENRYPLLGVTMVIKLQINSLTSGQAITSLSRLHTLFELRKWSGYGYGTVPGGLWTIDTEGGHVVIWFNMDVIIWRSNIQNG